MLREAVDELVCVYLCLCCVCVALLEGIMAKYRHHHHNRKPNRTHKLIPKHKGNAPLTMSHRYSHDCHAFGFQVIDHAPGIFSHLREVRARGVCV